MNRERKQTFEILSALVGYGIYQLIGLIHGLTSGLFLAINFKN